MISALHKQGMVVHACNPNTLKEETVEPVVQSHPRLLTESETSLRYKRPFSNNNNKGKTPIPTQMSKQRKEAQSVRARGDVIMEANAGMMWPQGKGCLKP